MEKLHINSLLWQSHLIFPLMVSISQRESVDMKKVQINGLIVCLTVIYEQNWLHLSGCRSLSFPPSPVCHYLTRRWNQWVLNMGEVFQCFIVHHLSCCTSSHCSWPITLESHPNCLHCWDPLKAFAAFKDISSLRSVLLYDFEWK